MSGDPEQEYFADGISEDIITALSKLPQLFVIARNSSFTFKGKAVHIGEVGREARREVRPGRQRPQGRQQSADHGATDRRHQQRSPLGRALRPRISTIFSPFKTR